MKIFFLNFVFLFFGLSVVFADEVTRELRLSKDVVEINKGELLLEDLVLNAHVLSKAEREVVVRKGVALGRTTKFSIYSLCDIMRGISSMQDISLSGSKYIRVKRVLNRTLVDKVKSDVVLELKKLEPWKGWVIRVDFKDKYNLVLDSVVEYSSLKIKVENKKVRLGLVALKVSFFDVDNKEVYKCRLLATVSREEVVYLVRSNMERGDIIHAGDIVEGSVWTEREFSRNVLKQDKIVGFELTRRKLSGEVVQGVDLINPTCARRNDIITVVAISGSLHVQMDGIALEKGRLGDRIKVENRKSHNVFTARLSGMKLAIVDK